MFESESILDNRYQLKQRLGKTAKGRQTWLAVDLETQEKVTVKLLAFSPDMAWEELKLFEREAKVLEALNHPRIPRYRNYFNLDKAQGYGVPWFALVQDYILGNSLQDLLDKTYLFKETQVRQIAIDVLEILVYLHRLSPPVLHRDIKPSNLILGDDEKIYLVDFGAVQAQAAVTGVTFTIVGTSGYAPLEQFWGKAVFASDLYGLGATLIHLLTGVVPSELPHQNYRIQFADKVNIQPHFSTWLHKMTDTLEKRFQDAKSALKSLESGELISNYSTEIVPTEIILKPERTNILIEETPKKLKVWLPVRGLQKSARKHLWYSLLHQGGMVALSIFALNTGFFLIRYLLFWLGFHFVYGIFLLLYLINPILSLYLTATIITGVIGHLLMSYNLELTPKYLIIQNNFLGGLWTKSKLIRTQSILQVTVHQIDHVSQVKIKTRQKDYTFGYGLDPDEAVWIAQTLQQWLQELPPQKSP